MEQHRHSHHDCRSEQSVGPEMFYGYCHDSGRMRMMNYQDYMGNLQTGYSNMYQGAMPGTAPAPSPSHHKHHHKDHGCGCHGGRQDCGCECCIRCADVVEFARCGESRRIPITFENDSRRERDVTLQLGAFATESGQETGWQAALSETTFKLPPCGEKTVLLAVNVDCSKVGGTGTTVNQPTGDQPGATRLPQETVDSCKVAYATIRAEGCTIRPLVVAVAVLPSHCGAHHAGCGCGCCCN